MSATVRRMIIEPTNDSLADRPGYQFEARGKESLLTAKMLLEMRRKVIAEVEQLRAYAAESPIDELQRVLNATADRLDDIVGGAPV